MIQPRRWPGASGCLGLVVVLASVKLGVRFAVFGLVSAFGFVDACGLVIGGTALVVLGWRLWRRGARRALDRWGRRGGWAFVAGREERPWGAETVSVHRARGDGRRLSGHRG